MIGAILDFAGEKIEVRVVGNQILFRTSTFGGQFTDIKGLKLDKAGTIKEFPDLKDKEDWKDIACKRFKDKIKKMKTEEEKMKYVMEDLNKFGYKPLYLQKQGHRPIKL